MFSFTIIFSGLFWQAISGQFTDCPDCLCQKRCWPAGAEPEADWLQKYQAKFDQLGVVNFSASATHILHGLTVEDAKTFFNIKLSNKNGIPSVNPNLTADDSDAILPNLLSRPNGYFSPGLHGFVDYMDHINDPDWMIHESKLGKILHAFHMQELWAVAQKAAADFSGVSEEICEGALDHANNGIEKTISGLFKYLKNLPTPVKPLTWDDKGESWSEWKISLPYHYVSSGRTKSMGLYAHCLMRKFNTEQPITLCCDSKKVGEYSYTKVSTGKTLSKCLNDCIYSRDDKPGSKYCFAEGEQKVYCLD